MYCIDRAGVPETHANPCENRMNSKAVRAASVKHKY